MYRTAVYFLYREVFDRTPELSELVSLVRDVDPPEAAVLLCQLNADLRLPRRDKQTVAKVQQELAAYFLDDETIARFKQRFGPVDMADRPVFHPVQVLNVLRLVLQHSAGSRKPVTDSVARYRLGSACLMMSDLLINAEETSEVAGGTVDVKMRALMMQMLGAFEVGNTASIAHLFYRGRIMFNQLLSKKEVVERISKECQGFDFERDFSQVVGVSLSHWLSLLFSLYCYLFHYFGVDSTRHPEFLCIDRKRFMEQSRIDPREMEILLRSISLNIDDFRRLLAETRPTDWRSDFVAFRSKPLIELYSEKCFCADVGFLVEKMHSGVYWAINDGLSSFERPKLFKAWGILFEEYVNWFLADRAFKQPLQFWPSPKWQDGTESFDGVFMYDRRLMPMEYKGGFLKIEARYSGNREVFDADLELKIGEGCKQLAWKIDALFNMNPARRKTLRDVRLDNITRIVPVLIVQDHILRGPFINWWINKIFNRLLDRTILRSDVIVDSVNVVGIHELETMAESAEAGTFDLFRALQLRCFTDPEMRSELHNFLLTIPGYAQARSERIDRTVDDYFTEINGYLFGAEEGPKAD